MDLENSAFLMLTLEFVAECCFRVRTRFGKPLRPLRHSSSQRDECLLRETSKHTYRISLSWLIRNDNNIT